MAAGAEGFPVLLWMPPRTALGQQSPCAPLTASTAPAKGDEGREAPARGEGLYRAISCTSMGNAEYHPEEG